MKLLLDENLSRRLVLTLGMHFPGTRHVEDVGLQGCPDRAVWDYAAVEGYVLVSKDNDFRQLSFLLGHPPKVVWLNVGNAGTRELGALLTSNRAGLLSFDENTEESLLILTLAWRP